MSTSARTILSVTGTDRVKFLQDLVTNDVEKLTRNVAVYAALLTPQGKYLADFFMIPAQDAIWLDVAQDSASALQKRLGLYRLRADVQIEPLALGVAAGIGPAPEGAFADPRHAEMGWRLYGGDAPDPVNLDPLRVAHVIPETGIELIADDSYILEQGFERLNGVDFRKGCYVGQEVTARMRHKTILRKGLVQVDIEGAAPVGTEITTDGKRVGTLYTQVGDKALAYLRFDRARGEMQADAARVTWQE